MPIEKSDWKWFGDAGHLIVAQWCHFHLCTQVGPWLVSTVGRYWPERSSREIHAKIHDPEWLAANAHLKGDFFDAAYMNRFGFEEVGAGRTFETMVFKTTGYCTSEDCGCGQPFILPMELDAAGYNRGGDATKGHMEMCEKWANRKPEENKNGWI